MDENRRNEIEEEERYRAQVRQNMQTENQQANKPSYWGGFVLNLVVIGLGFLVIGEWVWTIVWFALALVLTSITGGIAWPFMAVGVLIHYRNAYANKYKAGGST